MASKKNLTEETTKVVADGVIENTEPEGTDPEGTDPEDATGEEKEDGSKILVAVYPILFHSHQYKVGDTLPTNYPDMVDAWIEAGTAVWKGIEDVAPKTKAIPRTAEPGMPGAAVHSESKDGENLVGKVPKTDNRKK